MSQHKASLFSGVLSGIVGLMAFLVIHHFWTKPIGFILPMGLVIATLGGLVVGWAFQELIQPLPGKLWKIPAWTVLVSLALAPAAVLAQLRPAVFSPTGVANISVQGAVVIFIRDLLLTSAIVGGIEGWLIGRTRRAALIMALAGFVFALGPGHNVPFLGNTPATGKGIILLLAIILSSSVVLVLAQAVLAGSRIFTHQVGGDLHELN